MVAGQAAQIVSVVAGRIVVNLLQNAADLLTTYGAGAKVYLESDTSSAFSAPTVVSSTIIVSGTEQYEFVDTASAATTWYRVRAGNSAGSTYSDYSDGMQANTLRAYATLDDLLETMTVTDVKKYNALNDLLIDASDMLDELCERDFYRHPQGSGTETRYFHVVNSGRRSLAEALGFDLDIVSIATLEAADTTGGTYTAIAAGSAGYWLEPQNPKVGFPYEDVLLSGASTGSGSFAVGERVVRIDGVFGFARVPRPIKRATIDLAREWYRQGPGGGGPIGVSALGQPQFMRGMPDTVRQAVKKYKKRSFAHV